MSGPAQELAEGDVTDRGEEPDVSRELAAAKADLQRAKWLLAVAMGIMTDDQIVEFRHEVEEKEKGGTQ